MGGPAWQVLTGLPAWEITQIPRRMARVRNPRPATGLTTGRRSGLQALAAAYQRGAPVAFGWVRDRIGGRPVRVIAAGPGLAAAADGTGETILTLPAGARAAAAGRRRRGGVVRRRSRAGRRWPWSWPTCCSP